MVTIGLFSRIDAGSVGYRRGLVRKGFEIFEDARTHFIVLLGGLVSKRAIKKHLADLAQSLKAAGEKVDRKKIEEDYLNYLTEELNVAIPRLDHKKFYIMTSPSYDGVYGEIVAEKLTKLRSDIRYWEKADEHFPLKGINKRFLGLVPEKESWRSEYDSTPVDREVKDHQKRTTKPLPDIYGVGCFASSVYKPKGEAKRPYLSVPALHKLEEVKTAENQIGVTILEISPDEDLIHERKRTYNLKDLVSRERELIPIPLRCSENQVKVLNALKERGALTIGLLEDATGIERSKLVLILKRMLGLDRFQPAIAFDRASGRYDFDPEWIQKNLTYTCVKREEWQEDVLVGFACPHAGNIYTDYSFFVNQVPKVILKINARFFLGDGDFIEGLKHNLIERGEVYGGLDYTSQEMLVAHMVAEVMLKVFDARFKESWENLAKSQPSEEELEILIRDALLTFVYREGNHDLWMQDFGVAPLVTFRYELVKRLTEAITNALKEKNCYLPTLAKIIEGKVQMAEIYTLPSGVSLQMFHLHMARAKTTTLRLQECLSVSDCQVVILANFHVESSMNRWEPEIGQRVGMQLGAIVHKTKFEDNRGKRLDTGVGCLRIFSQNKRIMMSEEFYVSPEDKESLDNKEILESLEKRIGIR